MGVKDWDRQIRVVRWSVFGEKDLLIIREAIKQRYLKLQDYINAQTYEYKAKEFEEEKKTLQEILEQIKIVLGRYRRTGREE